MTDWAGFWIFCAVLVCCETFVVSRGIDGFIWHFKTPAELRLQEKLIERAAAQKGGAS